MSSHGGVDAIGQERQPPKKPVRPYSYSEEENESPRLINDEPVEIERDIPETDNKPVEREERQDKPVSISMDNKGPAYKTGCQSRERALSKEKPYETPWASRAVIAALPYIWRGLTHVDAELEEFAMDPGGVQHFPVFSDIFHFMLCLYFSNVLVIFLFTRALSAIPLFSNLW